MKDVKRFRHEPAFMVICKDGDYVLSSKYEELKTENERLDRRDSMLREVGCEYCGGSGWVSRIDGECLGPCDQCPSYELNCAKHEIEQLTAENLRLLNDAERYRGMRDLTLKQLDETPDEFDAEFDRQLNRSPENP